MPGYLSPCGVLCEECPYYPKDCGGCDIIQGRVFWLAYTGGQVCDIYRCCREKGLPHCGRCPGLPCHRFTDTPDPTKSEAENAEDLRAQLERLRHMT